MIVSTPTTTAMTPPPTLLAIKVSVSGSGTVTGSGRSGHLTVPPQVKTLSLIAPRGGVVGRAFASATANGAPTATLHSGGKQAFVTFEFMSQPPSGQSLTVAWFEPGGKLLGEASKSSAPTITSSVKSNGPLPRGAWHVDLRSGKTIVKTITINVQYGRHSVVPLLSPGTMDATLGGEVSADADIGRDQLVPEERRRLILELLRERRSITVGAVERAVRRLADDGASRPGDPRPRGTRPADARRRGAARPRGARGLVPAPSRASRSRTRSGWRRQS